MEFLVILFAVILAYGLYRLNNLEKAFKNVYPGILPEKSKK